MGRRSGLLGDDRLPLSGQRVARFGLVAGAGRHKDREPASVDRRPHLDIDLEWRGADLGEPEAELLDEVEREPVAAGRLRREQTEFDLDLVAGRNCPREGGARAVPDDRVAAVVEPVVGDLDAGLAARAPGGGTGILEPDDRAADTAGAGRVDGVGEPADGERPDGYRVLADPFHRGGSLEPMSEPLLVRTARREPVERTPVWFMRQAGRSLPEYRAIRARHSFFEVGGTPELCAEVTLQPVRRHGVDAAVMFADIMTPVLGMGIDVELVEGVGPVVEAPVRTQADVDRLTVGEPPEAVLEAVRLVRAELDADRAVIGFCGGPFTVAGYLVEGRPSRDFTIVKSLMYSEPAVWHALMEKLADTFAAYVRAKVAAGADVIQLFDSWVGALSPADYVEFVAPYSARILAAVDVPTIHFGTGTATLLRAMADAGGDVIGLDWRIPLDRGWDVVGDERGVQGNLDPMLLLGPWERLEATARDVLERAGGRPGHIFNLGHGVLPQTDPDVVTRLTQLVQTATVEARV